MGLVRKYRLLSLPPSACHLGLDLGPDHVLCHVPVLYLLQTRSVKLTIHSKPKSKDARDEKQYQDELPVSKLHRSPKKDY